MRFVDEDGKMTGIRGRIIDIDVSIEDEKLYLIEVKSRAELDHVEAFPIKAGAMEKFFKRKVDKIILVAVNVDREGYNRAIDLGIDVICGNVIDF
jgi:hypothetical protein